MLDGNPTFQTRPAGRVDFTTDIHPEREGFAFWQDEICRHLSPCLTERASPDDPFAASLRRAAVGQARICDITFSPVRYIRDERSLRSMPDDDVFVALIAKGTSHLEQRGRSTSLFAGDVVLYDSARPFRWFFEDDSRMVIARIARRQMAARLADVEGMVARRIEGGHPSASIIGTTITELSRLDGALSEDCSRRMGSGLIDLVASSIEASLAPAGCRPGDGDVLLRAKTFLLDNIDDPDLDLDRLTGHLGVPVRTLCRLFAKDGTTPIRWLWQQRLELAHRLLDEGRASHVSQIVMLCGFSDFSHFSRTFKKAYGVVPKSLLRKDAGSAPADRRT